VPAVAIVVRTQNRPLLLERALVSITGQSLVDWECVIVNDGGAREPVEALIASLPESYQRRVRAVHHEEARGRWVSANAGLLATSAPLLTLHDDDDTWHPQFLERAHDHLAEHPGADGVVSRVEIVWERFVDDHLEETSREIFQEQLHDVTLADTLLFNRFVPIGLVYRRSLHQELGLYDDSLPVVGDWSFYLKVLQRGPLSYLPGPPLAFWHQRTGDAGAHGNSVIAEGSAHERHDWLIRDEALREHVAEHGLGLVLYLTKFIDRRFVDVEDGIRDEVRQAREEMVRLHEQTRNRPRRFAGAVVRRARRRLRNDRP
jgi:glycosyltransferase involved in cell wall biosynthesis